MNFKEGMRRVALLVGVIGATLGACASYLVLRDAMAARARYKEFERLAKSEIVQQARASISKAPATPDDPYAAIAKPFSEVNRGGIRAIQWTNDLRVESIETEDGATLYASSVPTLRPYFLAAIFPLVALVVPLGLVRAVGWAGTGFLEKSK